MAFKVAEVNALLVECHRRCCICHRFCGVKIETHHIQPASDGGPDTIDNAIPVCFECHAEIQLYNDRHPRGRKFRSDELRLHKEQWLSICRDSPEALLAPTRPHDVGPIQALVDELEFNIELAGRVEEKDIGARFLVTQFERAITEGVFSLLQDSVREGISAVYASLMKANMDLTTMAGAQWGGPSNPARDHAYQSAKRTITSVRADLAAVHGALLEQLGHSLDDA